MRNCIILFLWIALVPLCPVGGQQTDSSPTAGATEALVDALLDGALTSAELGDWEAALTALGEAERISPGDQRVASYRILITELYALEIAQSSWSGGNTAVVRSGDPIPGDQTGTDGSGEPPKFVIDRGEDNPADDPSEDRDTLRADLSLKMFAADPVTSETLNTWSSGDEFLYSSIRIDLRYWMPFLRRSLGVGFRSNGYSWTPGDPEVLFNALDLGINLRGFLLEQPSSRLEIGIDFGASMLTTEDESEGYQRDFALYLGLWASDPLLYHLFRADSLENLVFGGGLRLYSTAGDQPLSTTNYQVDGAYHFGGGFAGVRLEWWDLDFLPERSAILSFSIFGGYRF